jgi:hypothetical protein
MTGLKVNTSLSDQMLSDDELDLMAVRSGFTQRAAKKIFAPVFIRLLFDQTIKHSPSFNDMASNMEKHTGVSVSKQAISQRMDQSCVTFAQSILAKLIAKQIPATFSQQRGVGERYQRILIQDSTLVHLPTRHLNVFSGVANAHSAVCHARIQGVYDVKSSQFLSFSIDPYSKNDHRAAPELKLQPGDLVLRDRGYLSAGEILRHINANADCIYRHKFTIGYLDPKTKEPIELTKLLRQHGCLDMEVLLNNKQQVPVRLVAAPIDEETANSRRRRAKLSFKGHAPSKEVLELMSWTIFITTIPKSNATFGQILDLYGLRWRIENIFKTWKSNMNFALIHNVSEYQLRTIFIARLSVLVIIFHHIFVPLRHRIRVLFSKSMSMMKLLRYLQINPERISPLTQLECQNRALLSAIARYCSYDSRKQRLNYAQEEEIILGLYR